MSVICQNFVQNAWKKDLCSNCFKSVGDHESIDDQNAEDTNRSEIQSRKFVSHAPNGHTSRNEPAPHTTWKSLISEKNGKNSQPFKLENGFQGRLLTINKALNGADKQNSVELNAKEKADAHSVTNGTSVKTVNGILKKQTIKSENVQQLKKNYSNIKNGTNFSNGQNSEEIKNAEKDGHTSILNKQNNIGCSAANEKTFDNKQIQSKCTKNKSEEVTANLHGILKKTTSIPADTGGQTRRSSNVGFKDEEPLVIGYGGRDFSPEELDWEMASDGEIENASDSLDETEDDKVFSKMTKQNTEFNSDNTNLLEKNKAEKNSKSNKNENKLKHENSQLTTKNKGQECKKETPKYIKNEKSNINENHLGTKNCHNSKAKNDVNGKKDEIQTSDAENMEGFGASDLKTTLTSEESDKKTVHSNIKSSNDSINVAIKSDKTSHAAKTTEVTVVQTTEAADSGVDVKNNPEFINGAAPSSCSVDARNRTESGKTTDAVMFSDGGETSWQENSSADRISEWQDEDAIPGQILQAINTSLTNRHKMRKNPDLNTDAEQENESSLKEDISENERNKISVSVNNEVIDLCNNSEEIEKVADEQVENSVNVEPRESFLHGVSKPSAIYGPASDLFVSRSNSSSSSSSDEQGKSQISLSINVIVNGNDCQQHTEKEDPESEEDENSTVAKECATEKAAQLISENRVKPEIPAKPTKQLFSKKHGQYDSSYTSKVKDGTSVTRTCGSANNEVLYYSTIPEGSRTSINLVDPYAESNIYHEVNDKDMLQSEEIEQTKVPGRESKLAALAIELEQVRHTNTSTKRQAPAPPKIPDPPLEDPPSCTGRISPTADLPNTFTTFRGESMAFSSASSTTSTSSQDTETGYTSWNLHGDSDDPPKHSKSKSSFLLAQYSKCKMLAMGYAEDGARARKKFSIKKLLKIGKETEAPITFDPNCPNPKAWKYSDHFERPRAKLEIIHPMDLENKSVTVNPGFDSLHSGSMSSFSASTDDTSFRNSISSDYGSFYSDTISPNQDLKQEVNYEYIEPRLPIMDEQEESGSKTGTSNSTSPTPSRSSTASQASTVTSGSSKNGAVPHRPPKPPPPPRAHSLLPSNKVIRNLDGTFKFPIINGDTSSSDEVTISPQKPQAPRRQCKSAIIRSEYNNMDQKTDQILLQDASNSDDATEKRQVDNQEEIYSRKTLCIQISQTEKEVTSNQQEEFKVTNEPIRKDTTTVPQEYEIYEDTTEMNSSLVGEGTYDNLVAEKETQEREKIQASITIKTGASSQKDKLSKSMLSRNKHPPLTKSPARPPPIYSKPQTGNFPKNMHPWKTLEDSYLALTSSNRELLIKLVNQALKKRKNFSSKLNKLQFQWADFEIDASQPSSVFAFGEKIAYHATMPRYSEYILTLVISIQQNRLQDNSEMKYPVFGKFTDCIPSEFLDSSGDNELESMSATILVLDRSNISTIECFSESLPESLTEESEKELCFIILQLIQSLKSLQVQGIESIDQNFQNLLLAKTKQDRYHNLVFLYDVCYDENDYSDSCKISLCQYTLMLLFQMLKFQTDDSIATPKFSSSMSRKVFETAFSLLSEEKAVSLSQTKTLFECYLWGVTKVLESIQDSDDCDSILHRWLDIERCNFIKSIINDEESDINMQNEYYSQFLIRTNARNIKEIASYL